MRILGIDPGRNGALALLDGRDLVEVADMPVFIVPRGKGTRAELDVHGVVDLLQRWKPDACWFENVSAQEGDGASQAFNFGRIAGACEAAAKLSGARFNAVAPHTWKAAMKLRGGAAGKDESRARATSLWPERAAEFRRKMDDGRAEAALLAEYGRLQSMKEIFG